MVLLRGPKWLTNNSDGEVGRDNWNAFFIKNRVTRIPELETILHSL